MEHWFIDELEFGGDYDPISFLSSECQGAYYADLARKKLFFERRISLEHIPKTLPDFY